jgi:hypothetical protein
MSEKAISPHKRMAMGDKVNKYAKGGMVTPRGTDGKREVADSEGPTLKSRAGVPHKPLTNK